MTHRTPDHLAHEELATLVKEHLLAGHLIDRAGMPTVIGRGIEVMRDIAIDEWMGASPLYSKRMQRLLGFEGDTVEVCLKGMQLDIGAPPEFMDFRYEVIDDHHATFHLDHCGALMDVEPMGEEYVVAMCHDIEDPTFDATGWATNPRLRMRPVHRPPRTPADRHPHCAWTVTIDETDEPTPTPSQAVRIGESRAAGLPLALIVADAGEPEGMLDYARPLDPDLQLRHFATPALAAIDDEVCLQGHLLVLAFTTAVASRFGDEEAVAAASQQFTGVAGVVAERLRKALGLGTSASDLATVFDLHPAFRPRSYVDWEVSVEGDTVRLGLGPCPALGERDRGFVSWITLLAAGQDRALSAVAAGVDPHWRVRADAARADGRRTWVAEWGSEPAEELPEVLLTRFSTGVAFGFDR